MNFLYNYNTWGSVIKYINPNTLDNYTFSYESDDFYKDGRLKKTDDGYYIGPNGWYDPSILKEDRVTYRFNNLFFRSNHFKKLNNKNINILYSGCSWTYGTGMHEELTWTNILSKNIQDINPDKQVESFNVALPGASIFLSIKNIMAFIRNYGTPEYIFINMPPIARDMRYDKKNNWFYSVVMGNGYFEGKYPDIYIDYIKQHNHEDSILKAVEQIKMLEDYCNASSIKLVWTYWHSSDKKVYDDIEFNNIFYPDLRFKQYLLKQEKNREYYPNNENKLLWELAQDGHHPGSCWNIHCAKEFLNELVRKKYEQIQ